MIKSIKICNGNCAYGWIEVEGKDYTFTISSDTLMTDVQLTIHSCPYRINSTPITDEYFRLIKERQEPLIKSSFKNTQKILDL